VYEYTQKFSTDETEFTAKSSDDKALLYKMNATLKKVTDDMTGKFAFNTAISAIMELVNEMYKYKEKDVNKALYKRAIDVLILMLAPFTPHICEEMWQDTGHDTVLTDERWPEYDEKALELDEEEIIVQINGKLKYRMNVEAKLDRDALRDSVMADSEVQKLIEGKNVVKVIAVPSRLVNFVIK
ncbi:MAG: class I tRNA ligase family protein, partial [Eubacteriales bacterium]|nr:class I tRNA ligase family protein [Eubacteriales bacterium]